MSQTPDRSRESATAAVVPGCADSSEQAASHPASSDFFEPDRPLADQPILHVLKLDSRAGLPAYQSTHAAGLDLAACLPRGDISADCITIAPGEIVKVPTGLAIAIPVGYEGQVRPRSGFATKYGLTLPNAPGTIDADYRGEVFVALINLGGESVQIVHSDRIAQLIIAPIARVSVCIAQNLSQTSRAVGGFGSTGGSAHFTATKPD